jgi:hypothetical protein
MARRRRAPRRRRRDTSIKLLNVAEGLAQGSLLTQAAAKVNAVEFVLGDVVPGVSSGGGISLIEIVKRPELLQTMAENISKPSTLANVAINSALLSVAFRFGKRALRRPINLMNRQVFKPMALGVKL